jgi:hypothetical protein
MSDTPETDEHIWVYAEYDNRKLVDAEFARKLEGERDKYQEQADALVDRLGVTQEKMFDAERERDEARSDLAFRRELYAFQELQLAKARKTILELQKK